MQFEEIRTTIDAYRKNGKRLFTTCSFQSHSLVLLHLLTRIDKTIPVYFLNTGYHFPETLNFRDQIASEWGLNLVDLRPVTPKYLQVDAQGKLLFTSDPDHCCHLNKTQPLERVLPHFDVWVNGVRADQSSARKAMKIEQPAPFNTIRFHPMLDWTAKMVHDYRKEYNLPAHPLVERGYLSIGCEPCTRKIDPEMLEREARWYGLNKTECGINTDLISN